MCETWTSLALFPPRLSQSSMDAELKAEKVVEDVQGHSVVFCLVGIYMNVLS